MAMELDVRGALPLAANHPDHNDSVNVAETTPPATGLPTGPQTVVPLETGNVVFSTLTGGTYRVLTNSTLDLQGRISEVRFDGDGRLGADMHLVAMRLASAGQPVPSPLLEALQGLFGGMIHECPPCPVEGTFALSTENDPGRTFISVAQEKQHFWSPFHWHEYP